MFAMLVVAVGVAAVMIVLWMKAKHESDAILDKFEPLRQEREELKREVSQLRAKVSQGPTQVAADTGAVVAKKSKKKKGEEGAEEKKLRELKEENFNLKEDLKKLRKEMRELDGADSESQRAIVEARADTDRFKQEVDVLRTRIKGLEQELAARSEEEGAVTSAAPVESDGEERSAAQAEIEKLQRLLRKAQGDFSELKRDHREELDALRKDAIAQIKGGNKERSQLKRQNSQLKKRADNNHKAFLVLRSQLMLVEQRLAAVDEAYKASVPMGTSQRHIEEALNFYHTKDAREAKAREDAQKAVAKLAQLEKTLRAKGLDPDALETSLEAVARPAAAVEAPAAAVEAPAPAEAPKRKDKKDRGKKKAEGDDKAVVAPEAEAPAEAPEASPVAEEESATADVVAEEKADGEAVDEDIDSGWDVAELEAEVKAD